MYDPEITHWEIKTVVSVGPRWFRINTIKLVNGKFETAIMDSDSDCKILTMNIHFYNTHKNESEAIEFNKNVSQKMQQLNNMFNFNENIDIINTIESNVIELNRYKNSVPYEYPEDLFGEKYR